jgi:hypothetical protein
VLDEYANGQLTTHLHQGPCLRMDPLGRRLGIESTGDDDKGRHQVRLRAGEDGIVLLRPRDMFVGDQGLQRWNDERQVRSMTE